MRRFTELGRHAADGVAYWPLMIGGPKRPAGLLDVTMPFDGGLLARVETSGIEHIECGLDTAYSLFRDRRRWLSLDERIGVLERCARIMSKMRDTLAATASREAGKPLRDSRIEVQHAIDEARLCVLDLRKDVGHVVPTGATRATAHRIALTRYEPVGVIVAISAFNHPLNVAAHAIFAAIAAGCPIVVKPAHEAPLSSLQIAVFLRQAGLPAAWCQIAVAADAATTESLITDVRVAKVSRAGDATTNGQFCGGLNAEKQRHPQCIGTAPVFVMERGLAASAVESITRAAYYHAGQLPISTQRIFVPSSFAHEFAVLLAERVERLDVGDPALVTTEVGPLIRPEEVDRIDAWVGDAVGRGAELLTGMSAIGESLYRPTVLFEPPPDAVLSHRYVLGPVVGIHAYDALDAAITAANDGRILLHVAVFTADLDAALRVFGKVDTVAVTVNDKVTSDYGDVPYAGVGFPIQGGIRHAINGMRRSKMLVVNSPEL